MPNFGEILKELRQRSGLTQIQLAERIWVTKATVSCYERNERVPSSENLKKIANVFHVSTDYLLGYDDKKRILDVSDLADEEIQVLEQTIELFRKNK